MKIITTEITDVKIISPKKFGDHRGFFSETYNSSALSNHGIDLIFCQDNHSFSRESGTLRGLHFQIPPFAQDKLVRVTRGAIFDVAVDIRYGSRTFGKWIGRTISEENWDQIFIPIGFAHGFCTIEKNTEVQYKVTAPYSPNHEKGIPWNDLSLAIDWPLNGAKPVISAKDDKYPGFVDLPRYFTC